MRFALVGVLALVAGCAWGGREPDRRPTAAVGGTAPARCNVGERPRYRVPAERGAPVALLGCARLGVSGERVEFSGSLTRIAGARHSCVNPAYGGRGTRGMFVPALCALDPPLTRFAVRAARGPRQGVRGYTYVIWGTAGDSTRVVARFAGGVSRAAVMAVPAGLARRFRESRFALFVVELPLAAACKPVVVTGSAGGSERVRPRAKLCERASAAVP